MDVHVPQAITDQLRRRARQRAWPAGFHSRHRLQNACRESAAAGPAFAGLLFGHQLGGTIGRYVRNLELIAHASEPADWINTVEYVPAVCCGLATRFTKLRQVLNQPFDSL